MAKALLLLLPMVALAAPQAGDSHLSGKRYALVIGNSEYRSLPPLPSAQVDMAAMQSALEDSQFQVTVLPDATNESYGKALQTFPLHPGDIFFFYFSGYTLQAENEDYLVPVDFDPSSPESLLPLRVLQDRVGDLTQALKIFMLEAPHKLDKAIPGFNSSSLAAPDRTMSRQGLFAFASSSGPVVAQSGVGLFTQAVVERIRRPGSGVIAVFQDAKSKVIGDTQSTQQPLEDDNLTPEYRAFYFHDPEPTKPTPPPRKAGDSFQNSRDLQEYVWIPPGDFMMGCVPKDTHCEQNEYPQHPVKITKGFWMGRNEVRVFDYKQWVAARRGAKMPGGSREDPHWKKREYPMINVSWPQAKEFCEAAGGRLPTEAEWEYAARAGSENQIYGFDVAHDQANYSKTPRERKVADRRTPVRNFSPNPWQLYDMAGNVWEWVNDSLGEKYYRESPAEDPQGPPQGKEHVVRGGGWDDILERKMRISYRGVSPAATNSIGFRCVLDDTPQTRKLLGLGPG